jgi:hypothetical protein
MRILQNLAKESNGCNSSMLSKNESQFWQSVTNSAIDWQ